MSFRELRSFTEMMRALGYPRLISMENFRTPNFVLVADILYWLVQRYDPSIDISDDISSEQGRVIFLKNIGHLMATKARIKLNTKKLYQADGYAVKELLKITTVLHDAMALKDGADAAEEEDAANVDLPGIMKRFDVKQIRKLASDITSATAELYDLLEKEPELREARRRALSKHVELDEVERAVRTLIDGAQEDLSSKEKSVAHLDSDLKNLTNKIEKKQVELERNQKRLLSLQQVRPHFMDEYEQLELQLQALYERYMQRFRNLHFLEHELDVSEQTEGELQATVQKKLGDARSRIASDKGVIFDSMERGNIDYSRPSRSGSGAARMMGTMNPSDDDSSDGLSSGGDDNIFDGGSSSGEISVGASGSGDAFEMSDGDGDLSIAEDDGLESSDDQF